MVNLVLFFLSDSFMLVGKSITLKKTVLLRIISFYLILLTATNFLSATHRLS